MKPINYILILNAYKLLIYLSKWMFEKSVDFSNIHFFIKKSEWNKFHSDMGAGGGFEPPTSGL